MSTRQAPSSALTTFVVASRYLPVYVALALLVAVAAIWAPATLRGPGLSAIAPFGTFLAITALGQMLVIMTGGIDLSVPGTLTLAAVVTVGAGNASDERIVAAIGTALLVAALVGLVNGILIGGLGLNALIVTLAVGQIVTGIAYRYYSSVAIQTPVPAGLSEWTSAKFLGITRSFWVGVAITVVLIVVFRFTTPGRRFQVVGANPVASWIAGLRVNLNQVSAYVVAAVLYGVAGILIAGLLHTPNTTIGAPYLLGPIAAVVIGGASLTGGSGQPAVHVGRGHLPRGAQPDAAGHGPAHRAPVRCVRPRHHRRHARLGRPDHPGGGAGPSRAETTGSLGDAVHRRPRRGTRAEGGSDVTDDDPR